MVRLTGTVCAVLVVAGLAAPARGQNAPALKLAYVNSQVILANTPGRAQAESTFQRELAGMQQQVNVLQSQFDSAVSEFNRTSLVLSPSAKQQRQQELQQMQQRTAQQVQDLRDRATQREQELMAPITQRVQAVIEGIRAEGNYAMIFDAAAQAGGLISADRSLDLSQLVIQRLQAGGTGATPPPPLPAAQPADTTHPAPPSAAARPPRGARPNQP
ncbi:MAG TPA: OmpH family outer membrane protein [Gemmatimonadales bacterium]|nr:OmpH family outer membrane protein [Gemmatimonadales bacterium]